MVQADYIGALEHLMSHRELCLSTIVCNKECIIPFTRKISDLYMFCPLRLECLWGVPRQHLPRLLLHKCLYKLYPTPQPNQKRGTVRERRSQMYPLTCQTHSIPAQSPFSSMPTCPSMWVTAPTPSTPTSKTTPTWTTINLYRSPTQSRTTVSS